MIRGIDVSAVQGRIDWQSVAASGVRFAIMKCAQGNETGRDPTFATNVAGARAVGLAVGCYMFAYPLPPSTVNKNRDPIDQARLHFSKCDGVGAADGDVSVCVDLEWPVPEDWAKWNCSAAQIRDWGIAYLNEVRSLWKRTPIVYTYPWYWSHVQAAGGTDPYSAADLWIADYSHHAASAPPDGASPLVPKPWSQWALWQHSGGGVKLPNGVPVDGDVFNGDEIAWSAFLKRTYVEPVEPAMTKPKNDLGTV